MKSQLNEIKTRFKAKIDADHSLSGTYRGKIMRMLDAAIDEVFNGFKGDRG